MNKGTAMRSKIYTVFKVITSVILVALMAGCSSSGADSASASPTTGQNTGSITVKLDWGSTTKTTAKTVASAPSGVATVRVIITGSGMTSVQKDFTATTGGGTIDGVPVGTGRTVTTQGLNGSGVVTYQGSAANITVQAGQTTDIGTITMTAITTGSTALPYAIVDTGQIKFYSSSGEITAPVAGQSYYGQDPQFSSNQPSYKDNGDGTITDLNSGLMWVQARGSRTTWDAAIASASTNRTGGYSDWRMPTIKELYSLIKFNGVNGPNNMVTTGFTPFIDTTYFGFAYGSGTGTERVIDCQDWSATEYVSTTMNGDATVFGVNFADGRIKGYPKYKPGTSTGNTMYARYVRGSTSYGTNSFVNNGDGTITDQATALMWSQADSGTGYDWPGALAWVQAKNAVNYLGHSDWRLPNIKELQSIVDYTRSPAKTASAAINPTYFTTTGITNELSQPDYPYFWSGTTLLDGGPNPSATYISFGRAMGYMNGSWLDVHGAGSQKSDLMVGNPSSCPTGRGPQGDAVRIYNFIRLVRDE